MGVILAAIERVAEAATRVSVFIKLDYRPAAGQGRLAWDVEPVERRLR